jgi:sodium/hydrogen exchanger 8
MLTQWGTDLHARHHRRHHDVDFHLSEPLDLKPFQSTLQQAGLGCAGHFTPFSECQKSCYRWREYVVDSPAQDGGEPCMHLNGFIDRQPCTDGVCPLEELPPTGDLPNEVKPATRVHHLATEIALPFALAIVLSMCIGEVVHHVPWLRAIPHSLVTILVAGSMGFMLRAHEDRFGADAFSPVCTGVMNLILLPIIIFQAGWSMRHKDFADNFMYICIFAVFGTALSTVLIGSMVWITGSWGWHVITGAREAFAIASLISATDPVATLSAFAAKKVERNLNIMVLGESTINDAVAIALFNMLNVDEPTAYWFFPSAGLKTFKLLVVSILIGFIMGSLLVMMFRGVKQVAEGHDQKGQETDRGTTFEVMYVLGSAYLINAVAECLHMSGIIACLFGGITMGIYIRAHMSPAAEQNTTYYIGTASESADLTVFIMVGVTTALIKSSKGFRFGALLLLFCLVGRFATVFTCGSMCNVVHRARFGGALTNFLSLPKQLMMWHAGLRGGIALTLALQLNEWCEHKAVLVTGTFIVIFCLMVMMGSTIDAMLNLCKIETGCVTEPVSYKDIHLAAQDAKGLGSSMHLRVLHPLLVGDATMQKRLQMV